MEKINPEFLGKFSIVIETYPGKSIRIHINLSCLEGINLANPKSLSKVKRSCLLRFIPSKYELVDEATGNKVEALKILNEITPILKSGEKERAEKEIIEFFLNR